MTDLELLIQDWDNRPCDTCGASCLPRISHKILKVNKKKVIERVFYK